jgi:hypothetical protein
MLTALNRPAAFWRQALHGPSRIERGWTPDDPWSGGLEAESVCQTAGQARHHGWPEKVDNQVKRTHFDGV